MAGLLTELAGEMTVIAPTKKGDNLLFEPISDGREAALDSANTRLSPKGVLFPQCEQMMTFTTDRKQARLVAEESNGYSHTFFLDTTLKNVLICNLQG